MQNDIDNIFLRKAQLTVDMNPENLIMIKIGNLFPFLIPFVMFIIISRVILTHLFRKLVPKWFLPQIEESAPFWIINRVDQIINEKQSHSVDLLQLMLDASTKETIKVRN